MRLRAMPLLLGMLALLASTLRAAPAPAEQLIADISQHLVAITTGFTGADVLLFGATGGEGEVIVIVRGPESAAVVRRKERIAGIWINARRMTFHEVPAFYHVAASGDLAARPVEEILKEYEVGPEYRRIWPAGAKDDINPEQAATFRAAFIRGKQREGLYATKTWPVTFIGDRLFRTTIRFPANVPTGTYTVEVFNVTGGRVSNMLTTPLIVSRAGFGAAVYDFAYNYAAGYGLIAILIALMAGWLAGTLFRKV